jgi:arylsulfatase A
MKHITRWIKGLVGLGLVMAMAGLATVAAQPRRPNIVVILADDMGWGDPGCYNAQSKTPTPNIDRLAAQGMRFTDAHSPSSVCTPTRYGLLTGRYAWRTRLKSGVLQGYDPLLLEPGRMTIASILKARGYHTGAVGKWHLGFGNQKPVNYAQPLVPGPNAVGFDYFFGIPASLDFTPYVYVENEKATALPTATVADSKHQRDGGTGFWRGGEAALGFKHDETLEVLTGKAEAFIQKQSQAQPFFLYFPLTAPHTPWLPTGEFRGKSRAGDYGDFVVQTDATVGRVLKALEAAKLDDNTLVIFTSDNGAHWLPHEITRYKHQANGQWRGQKADIWDGGHRVPFIARWPGKIKAKSVSNELICLTDLMATMASVAGTELPENAAEDSYSILPALLGRKQKQQIREAIVHHSVDGTFAIRQGEWKLALGLGSRGFSEPKAIDPVPGAAAGQLYNLKADPSETNNLWLQKPEIVARLTALLEKYQRDGRSVAPRTRQSLSAANAAQTKNGKARPNVLFLFSDDQRVDTIRALGNPHITTPTLDQLVQQGTTFTQAYCMGAQQGAVCVPSRAMMMSGRTLFRISEKLEGQTTWPRVLAENGYATFGVGKWHNQPPSFIKTFAEGKAVFFGGMHDPFAMPAQNLGADHQLTSKETLGKHATEAFADAAIEFLQRQKGNNPFALYVSFTLPHDPRTAPKPYHAMYDPAKLPLPKNFLPEHPFDNGEMKVRDELLAPWPRTPEIVRQHLADYYACVTYLDAQIGRILEALRQSGQYDNTIIVFASDHGLAIGSHGLFGKQNLYEHSMNAPLIIAGPGVPKNRRSDAFAYLLDLFPTLCDLTGLQTPAEVEGLSLAPVIAGQQKTRRDTIFTSYRDVQRAVRDDRWKLIVYPKINRQQLFDLKNDPAEMNDLAGNPKYAQQLERLAALLKKEQTRFSDPLLKDSVHANK